MVKDMTRGNPIKLILSFCLPLVAGNIFQQLYNMVDSIIVGKFVGVNALAAVGATGSINFLVLGFALGLCSGFGIPVAQCFGAQNYSMMRKHVANALYLCLFATILLTTITLFTTPSLLRLMQTPSDIYQDSYTYISIMFMGIIATIYYNMLSSILRALGDSKTPLLFLAVASIINVILDYTFVVYFKMGVAGVAWATLIAQAISAVLCAFFMAKHFPILKFSKEELKLDGHCCKELLAIGLPMALQFSITAVGSVMIQTAINGLGSAKVAAVTAANKIQMMFTQPLDTLGTTMATYCGQNLGAKKIDRIKDGLKKSFLLSFGYCLLACLIMWTLSTKIALLFIDANEVAILSDVQLYLRIDSVFYFVLGILFITRNSLQGLGYSALTMLAGLAELIGRGVVAFLFVGSFGYAAICAANPFAWFLADVILITTFVVKLKELNKIVQVD